MTPTDAERVSCGVGEDVVAVLVRRVAVPQKGSSAESCRLCNRGCRVDGVEVEVDLLRSAVGPIRGYVVGSVLHSDHPVAVVIEDAVESRVIVDHSAVEHRRPEAALGFDVLGVEDDHVADQSHAGQQFWHPRAERSDLRVPIPSSLREAGHPSPHPDGSQKIAMSTALSVG